MIFTFTILITLVQLDQTRTAPALQRKVDTSILETIAGLGQGQPLLSRPAQNSSADLGGFDSVGGGGLIGWKNQGSHPSLVSTGSESTMTGLSVNLGPNFSSLFGNSET